MLTSTVLVAQIREAPDVAQSDASSANREKKVEARRPRIALLKTVRLYCKDRIKSASRAFKLTNLRDVAARTRQFRR